MLAVLVDAPDGATFAGLPQGYIPVRGTILFGAYSAEKRLDVFFCNSVLVHFTSSRPPACSAAPYNLILPDIGEPVNTFSEVGGNKKSPQGEPQGDIGRNRVVTAICYRPSPATASQYSTP